MASNYFLKAGVLALSSGLVALPAMANPQGDVEALNSVAPISVEAESLVFEDAASYEFAAITIQPAEEADATVPQFAQRPYENSDGRRTSSKFSYIGIGGVLGLSDDSEYDLGDGGFSLMSKTGFTENISLHNLSVLGNDPVATFALTADFPIRNGEAEDSAIAAVPFFGGGLAISNLLQDDSEAAFMLTTGVDVPLAYRWTATGRVAVAFFDETEAAIGVGIGYTFTGFFK